MESRAKILGHAIHPIVVAFPIGLLLASLLFDALRLLTGEKKWSTVAFWNMLAGCISGWLVAIPGAIDWWFLPRHSRAKKVATIHGVVNDVAINLFIASWLRRRANAEEPDRLALLLSLLGAGVLGVGGWLGGELVERLGVGVSPGANLDAPSSLTHPELPETSGR
jgi:uncharacterized membrane protein